MKSGAKELIRSAVEHRETERVPYNFMFSPPAEKRLKEHYGVEDLITGLEMPMFLFGPKDKPLYADPEVYGETITDQFGVVWSTSKIDRGSLISFSRRSEEVRRTRRGSCEAEGSLPDSSCRRPMGEGGVYARSWQPLHGCSGESEIR